MKEEHLIKNYQEAEARLKFTISADEKIFLMTYIDILYDTLARMKQADSLQNTAFLNFDHYQLYAREMRTYQRKDRMQFLTNRDFYRSYISNLLYHIRDDYHNLPSFVPARENGLISQDEYWDIIYSFLKEYHLDLFLDDIRKKQGLHFLEEGEEAGFALCNPFNGNIDLFIENFHFDIFSMQTLIHELGHAYDFKKFKGTAGDYNNYYYLSSYTEVLSFLFERLFLRYLARNHIQEERVQNELLRFYELNYLMISSANIYTLLEDKYLRLSGKENITGNEIINQVKHYYKDQEELNKIVNKMMECDLSLVYRYTLGDVLSLFLCEEVEKNGFLQEFMNDFLEERKKEFSHIFLLDHNASSENYAKLYKKELQLIKK